MASDTYLWLARYYDHLFEYRRQFDKARAEVIGPLLPQVRSACDLCCGTGALALELAGRGIRVFAVDLSPEMCKLARRKVRGTGLPVTVLEGDMRTFRLPEPVDLVTCEFDALNHVPKKADLGRVLRAVARALRPGGHFAFDVNNRRAFETVWSNTWFLEKDPVALVMRSGHRPGKDRAWSDTDWFIREGTKWTRHSEHIEEVCWPAAEMRAALAAAGFHQVKAWDAAPFFEDALTPPGNRTFWRARRKQSVS